MFVMTHIITLEPGRSYGMQDEGCLVLPTLSMVTVSLDLRPETYRHKFVSIGGFKKHWLL